MIQTVIVSLDLFVELTIADPSTMKQVALLIAVWKNVRHKIKYVYLILGLIADTPKGNTSLPSGKKCGSYKSIIIVFPK